MARLRRMSDCGLNGVGVHVDQLVGRGALLVVGLLTGTTLYRQRT